MAKLTSTAPSSTRTPAPAETPKLTKRRVSFKISAPEAQEVYLSGSFNEWSYTTTALKRDATGAGDARASAILAAQRLRVLQAMPSTSRPPRVPMSTSWSTSYIRCAQAPARATPNA